MRLIRDRETYRTDFLQHRNNADIRNIPFRLTFQEWLNIWIESGQLANRGRRVGQYVMARKGDEGGYEVGNVEIVTCTKNMRDSILFRQQRRSGYAQSRNTILEPDHIVLVLREARLKANLNQSSVARAIGISFWTYSRFERGECKFKKQWISRLPDPLRAAAIKFLAEEVAQLS